MLRGFGTRREARGGFGFGGSGVYAVGGTERWIRSVWIDFGEVAEKGIGGGRMELLTHVSHLQSYEDKSKADKSVQQDKVVTV